MVKRRRRRKIKGSALKIAKRALRKVKVVEKKVKHVEIKFANSGFVTALVTNVGVVTHRMLVVQGIGQAQRIGASINVKHIDFRGSISQNPAAASGFSTVRILIFLDKQQIGDAQATPGVILQDLNPYSPLDMATGVKRFRVLYDRFIYLNTQDHRSTTFRFRKRLNILMKWNGAASADIQKNGLFIMFIGDEAANQPTFNYYFRGMYYDL